MCICLVASSPALIRPLEGRVAFTPRSATALLYNTYTTQSAGSGRAPMDTRTVLPSSAHPHRFAFARTCGSARRPCEHPMPTTSRAVLCQHAPIHRELPSARPRCCEARYAALNLHHGADRTCAAAWRPPRPSTNTTTCLATRSPRARSMPRGEFRVRWRSTSQGAGAQATPLARRSWAPLEPLSFCGIASALPISTRSARIIGVSPLWDEI